MNISNRALFLKHSAQTTDSPMMLEVDRAEGVYLYNGDKDYIDMISGISVSNIGHCNPKVVAAIQKQSSEFMHLMVYGEYIYSPQVKLSKTLCDILPSHLDNVFLVNSGSEATEAAIKLCKKYTKRSKLISFRNSYHGSTNGALSLIGDEYFKSNYRPLLPDCHLLNYNNKEDLEQIDTNTAGVFLELVQAESGITEIDIDFLDKLVTKCKETKTLLVVDEIQTGFGRVGELFAIDKYSIKPDILLLAKAMGGGMPIGAMISSKEIMNTFMDNPILGHITTFGGNPVTAAAAIANIEFLSENKHLINQANDKGKYLKEKLFKITNRTIAQVGLMLSIDNHDSEQNISFIKICVELGIITDWFLFNSNKMRICPPLIITYDEINEFLRRFKIAWNKFKAL